MRHWLLLATLAVLVLAIGRWRRADRAGHRGLHATAGTLVWIAVVSWAAMRLGVFSLPLLFLVSAPVAALVARRAPPPPAEAPREDLAGWLALAVLGALFVIYESHPTSYFLGGRDPGLYVAFSAHIARTGGLNLDLPAIAAMWERTGGAIDGDFPGIYSEAARGFSTDRSQLLPQFTHLFPSLGAAVWSAFGPSGYVRTNAVVMVLGLWSFHAVIRRVLPPGWALATLGVVGLNAAVIWSGRHGMTEPLSLLFSWYGLHLLFEGEERVDARWSAVGGVILGLAVLARLDASVHVLPVLGLAAAGFDDAGGRRRALAATLGFAGGATVGFVDAWIHATPYVLDLAAQGTTPRLIAVAAGGVAAALALIAAPERSRPLLARAARAGMLVAVAAVAVWLAYDWAIRSLDSTDFARRSIRELAWYTTPVAFALAAAGLFVAALDRRRALWWPLVVLAGLTLFAYTAEPSISPDHPWATRRWVPHVIPSLGLFSVAALAGAARGRPHVARLAVAAGIAAAAGYAVTTWQRVQPFLFESMLDGVPEDYTDVVEILRARRHHRVAFTDDAQIASILTYAYGQPTLLIPSPLTEELARALDGYPVITTRLDDPWVVPAAMHRLGGPFVVPATGAPATRLGTWQHDLVIGQISVLAPGRLRLDPLRYAARDLFTVVGSRDDRQAIQTTGLGGYLQFGPYASLEPGLYVAQWEGVVRAGGRVTVDVVADTVTFATRELTLEPAPHRQIFTSLPFEIDARTDAVEARVSVDDEADLTVFAVTLFPLTRPR